MYSAWEARDGSRIRTSSGANFRISDADFSELDEQVSDTLIFLEENKERLRRIRVFPGLEYFTIDFAADIDRQGFSKSFKFPNELLVLAGSLGISLELTVYPFTEPDDPEVASVDTI